MDSGSDDLLEVVEIPEDDPEDQDLNSDDGPENVDLSNTDELVYDRQIRLWGLQAQKKIMTSKVLFLGKSGILEETMKNLLLAGMNVTLVNDHLVSERDVKLSFFLRPEDLGKPHSVTLCNRMSSITLDEKRITGLNSNFLVEDKIGYKFKDAKALKPFNVVCISTLDYPLHKLEPVNETCRNMGIAFFATLSCGTYGYFFTDLNRHKVLETFNKKSESVTIEYRNLSSVLREPKFPRNCDVAIRSLMALVSLLKSHDPGSLTSADLESTSKPFKGSPETLSEMVDMYGKEFPITSSILGGYIALEVRKFVTKQHETIPNFCVFDMSNSSVSTAMI